MCCWGSCLPHPPLQRPPEVLQRVLISHRLERWWELSCAARMLASCLMRRLPLQRSPQGVLHVALQKLPPEVLQSVYKNFVRYRLRCRCCRHRAAPARQRLRRSLPSWPPRGCAERGGPRQHPDFGAAVRAALQVKTKHPFYSKQNRRLHWHCADTVLLLNLSSARVAAPQKGSAQLARPWLR